MPEVFCSQSLLLRKVENAEKRGLGKVAETEKPVRKQL